MSFSHLLFFFLFPRVQKDFDDAIAQCSTVRYSIIRLCGEVHGLLLMWIWMDIQMDSKQHVHVHGQGEQFNRSGGCQQKSPSLVVDPPSP